MSVARRILKNFLSLLSAGIITNLLSFVAIIYLARILGPGDFGKISFAMAIVAYFTVIANLGLPLLGTREVAREKDKIKDYLGNILTLRLCLAIFGFGLLLLMVFFLNKPLEIKYLIILYGLGLIPSALLLDWAFQGVEKMEYIGLGRILSSGIYLGLVFWLIRSPKQLLLVPCFQVAGNLLAAGLLFSIFVKNFGKPKLKFDLISWKISLKQALPIGIPIIIGPIIRYIDIVTLGMMRSSEEVGYYSAACKIVILLVMLSVVYQDAIYPVVSNFYKTSLDSLKKIQSYSAKLMVTTALPLAVGGTILAPPIMNLLYGANYGAGIIVFQILIWSFAFECTYSVFARGLIACNREVKRLKIFIVLTISNVVFILALIPPLGLKGAAIAIVLVRILGFFLFHREFNKIVPIPIHNYILKPLLASAIMGLFIYYCLNLNVFFLILGVMLIYFMSFYLMGGLTREELKTIRSIISGE